jgi:protein O-mannosyl-transferase
VVDYYDWPIAHRLLPVLPQGAVLLLLLGATVFAIVRRGWLGFVGGWFFLILAPSSSFLPLATEVAAERRMYLPLAAVVLVVTAIGWRSIRSLIKSERGAAAVGFVCVAIVAMGLMARNIKRTRDYRTGVALWTDTVAHRPNNARAFYNLGHTLAIERYHGDSPEVLDCYRQSWKRDPNFGLAISQLARLLPQQPDPAEAIDFFQKQLARHPDSVLAKIGLARLYARAGDGPSAQRYFESVLETDPNDIDANIGLGELFLSQKDWDRAARYLRIAVTVGGDSPEGRRARDDLNTISELTHPESQTAPR